MAEKLERKESVRRKSKALTRDYALVSGGRGRLGAEAQSTVMANDVGDATVEHMAEIEEEEEVIWRRQGAAHDAITTFDFLPEPEGFKN